MLKVTANARIRNGPSTSAQKIGAACSAHAHFSVMPTSPGMPLESL